MQASSQRSVRHIRPLRGGAATHMARERSELLTARIDPAVVRSIVARARPSPPSVARERDPDPAKPPAELLRALGDSNALSEAKWASLRSLDRYALSSAAKSSTGRLDDAYREII